MHLSFLHDKCKWHGQSKDQFPTGYHCGQRLVIGKIYASVNKNY